MKKRVISKVLLTAFIFFTLFFNINLNANGPSIRYQAHVQDYGWMSWVKEREIAGTTGKAKRMEAIIINLNGINGKLSYKVHVQDYGWLEEVPQGTIAGTTGRSKRMEAIIIKMNDSLYTIKYRVHVQDIGWMNWVKEGEVAGTTGKSKRMEAIEIVLEKKSESSEISNNNGNANNMISSNVTNNSIISNTIQNIISDSTPNTFNSNTSINVNDVANEKIYFGIDVSKYQGSINWSKVKNSNIDFVMIRCAYRGYTEGKISEDPTFLNNVKGAYANGIKIGLYFYSSAINETEALEEANYVLNLINKYGIKNYISYPIVIDVEDFEGTRNYSLSVQERTNIVKTFCNKIKNSGFKPMVYSYTYFLENKLYMNQLKEYDTWIADYHGNTWYNRNYSIWQYTDKGRIDGIIGDVDLNYCYKNF